MDPIQEALEDLLKAAGVTITPRSSDKAWAKSSKTPRGFVIYRGTEVVTSGEGSVPVSAYTAYMVVPMWRYMKPHVDRIVAQIEGSDQFTVRHPISADIAVPPVDSANLGDVITINVVSTEVVGY